MSESAPPYTLSDQILLMRDIAITAIKAAAKRCNATVVDPTPYLCPNGNCMGSKDGIPLYFDDNHLVDAGNEQLRGLFSGVIK
ncbi:SGNH hydrolase domain-containing protein [Pseudomonas sp. Y39-6]|uniref:SGNH hydrolase domain-containing protein n=1 Tax=Pseudomonas sp. Y39-6 TaxID=2749807 RepID=UPI002E2D61AE|nr:SGNH hydrolase domain-containing protein [Pseudomonas sp. Y39-6]